jgi:hypothetical protein
MSEFKKQMISSVVKFINETPDEDIKFNTLLPAVANFYVDLKSNLKKKVASQRRKSNWKNDYVLNKFVGKMKVLLDDENMERDDFIGELGQYYMMLCRENCNQPPIKKRKTSAN